MAGAPRICGCGHKIAAGEPCPCERKRAAARDQARPSAHARGYDKRWQRESKAFLALPENRFCACGCGRAADVVDHLVPHKGNRTIFWDRSNWRPMARACNSRKNAISEGGFGNRQRPVGGRQRRERLKAGDHGPSSTRDTREIFPPREVENQEEREWFF